MEAQSQNVQVEALIGNRPSVAVTVLPSLDSAHNSSAPLDTQPHRNSIFSLLTLVSFPSFLNHFGGASPLQVQATKYDRFMDSVGFVA